MESSWQETGTETVVLAGGTAYGRCSGSSPVTAAVDAAAEAAGMVLELAWVAL